MKTEKKNEFIIPDHTPFLKQLMPYCQNIPELDQTYRHFEAGISPQAIDQPGGPQPNQLVFPIRNEEGVLYGFSTCSSDPEEKEIKYTYTTSREGFQSSEILYGLYYAKQAIELSGQVFLVEGYKNVLAMHAAGLENCVAWMGTHLSDKQISLLKQYAAKVYILTNGDETEATAVQAIMRQIRKEKLKAYRIELPGGENPDSLFRKEGGRKLANRIQSGSIQPHTSEYLLVTACLLYPNVSMVPGHPEPFPSMTELTLMAEDVSMESPFHNHLLECIVAGYLSEDYQKTVKQYTDKSGEAISFLIGSIGSTENMLKTILLRFVDDRLEDEKERLCRRLKFARDMTERGILLEELNKRKVQQEMVAEELESMGKASQ